MSSPVTFIEPATPALLEWVLLRRWWRCEWGTPPGLNTRDQYVTEFKWSNETLFVCMSIER